MIAISPRDYADQGASKVLETFFKDMLKSHGVPVNSVNISPVHYIGTFVRGAGDTTADTWFKDISAQDVVPGRIANFNNLDTMKTYYYGRLRMIDFVTSSLGAFSYEAGVISGWNINLGSPRYMAMKQRTFGAIVANDLARNDPSASSARKYNIDVDDMLFKAPAILLNASAVYNEVTMNYSFTGLKIEY